MQATAPTIRAALDPADLAAQRILVVAPHPDDESLGCGGLIAILGALGRRFHTLFVTDGGASHLGSLAWPRQRIAAQREREAAAALARLGIGAHPTTFLRLPDADMPKSGSPARAGALATVTQLLRSLRPDLVLLPWRRDPHRDHRDAWRLVTDALSETGLLPDTLEYAIWLDELGTGDDHPRPDEAERIVFDIGPAVAVKRVAVHAHLSQTTDLISDDPDAFRLTPGTIDRLTGATETYWRPL